MSESIHVHEVLFWLQKVQTPMTRQSFAENLDAKFGSECSFRSCSEHGLRGDAVLKFLLQRHKLIEVNGEIDLHPQLKICDGHLK